MSEAEAIWAIVLVVYVLAGAFISGYAAGHHDGRRGK